MSVKLGRRTIIKVSIEDVMGTAKAGATAMVVYDPDINPADKLVQREPSGAYGGQSAARQGPREGACKFKTELRSDGAGALDAGLLACLRACGRQVSGSSLKPVTAVASQVTLTIDVYKDGLHERLYGAMGKATLEFELGKQVFVNFEFQGIYSFIGDAALPAVAAPAGGPMMSLANTLTIGGTTPKASKISIADNNPVEMREDLTAVASGGLSHAFVAMGRRYTIGIDPESVAAGTWNLHALWAANTEVAFSLTISDGTTVITLAAPKCQLTAPQGGVRGTKAIYQLTMQCNADEGDDEFTLSWAAA